MYFGLLFTLFTGLFFLIGIIILNKLKNKVRIGRFTIALAFVVVAYLLVFDIFPELFETHNYMLIIPIIIGFSLLIILDKFIPHHSHNHHDGDETKKDHLEHLNHISVITIISLAVHNMIEGLTLYSVTLNSVKAGLLMMLGISLHNIPLGFQIGNSLNVKRKNYLLIFLLCISSVLGALIFILFGTINEYVINVCLALTFGMLLYILIFELLGEVKNNIKYDETIYGISVGIFILLIAILL